MNGKREDLRLEGDWGKLMDVCNMQYTHTYTKCKGSICMFKFLKYAYISLNIHLYFMHWKRAFIQLSVTVTENKNDKCVKQ